MPTRPAVRRPRPTHSARRSPDQRASNVAQWFVLGLLVVLVTIASLGLPTLRAALDAMRGVTFVPQTAPTVGEPPPAVPDAELQTRVASASMLSRGTIGVAVERLSSGSTASINAEQTFPAASLFKVPILLEVLAQEAEGRLPPDRSLEIGADDWSEGSGVLQARIGERLTVRELRRLMIQESDNIAALVLLDAVGAASVNRRMERLDLRSTRVIDFRAGERGEHVTTPADMARLFFLLAEGRVVDARVSEEALRTLELPQAHAWLAEGLPWWVKVAHKWGDLPDARNDVGVVFTPRGDYVVAVLTQNAAPDEARRAITRLSQTVYEGLRN